MKTYTIQFDLFEGSDEFWESNPSPLEVLKLFKESVNYLYIDNLKVIKFIDETEYEYDDE